MTTGQSGSQKIETRIGPFEFTHDFANGFPTLPGGSVTRRRASEGLGQVNREGRCRTVQD